jgi:hypothetical protein
MSDADSNLPTQKRKRQPRQNRGLSKTVEYGIWRGIKRRCFEPDNLSYKSYGAAGITICDRWRFSFANFLADMGPRPSPKHSVDRYPNQRGNYEPGNCRWATQTQQMNNKITNANISFNGFTMTLAEWSRRLGLSDSALANRLKKWPLEVAMNPTINFKQMAALNWQSKKRKFLGDDSQLNLSDDSHLGGT